MKVAHIICGRNYNYRDLVDNLANVLFKVVEGKLTTFVREIWPSFSCIMTYIRHYKTLNSINEMHPWQHNSSFFILAMNV